MPRFAANLSFLFQEVPFLERFALASAAGFAGVEYLYPYEYAVGDLALLLKQHNLENVLFNVGQGNREAGERGIACIPGREAEFRSNIAEALDYAQALGVSRLHAMAGILPAGVDRTRARATYIDNLRFGAAQCAPRGITLLIEAINTNDIPGFFINYQHEAYEICQEVGAPNLKMQMDLYHMQMMEGNLAAKLRQYAPLCGHVQIAGVPGRHEPDNGEIDYPYLFDVLDELGYTGWVGCEYRPAGTTMEGLGWFKRATRAG